MIPNADYITIPNTRNLIDKFVREIIISPKKTLKSWSQITRQTPSFKIGYTGQHLASLITGVEGRGSGARGDDLRDGTEVKSCNKIDQLDKCKDCGESVLRYETECSNCHSKRIDRKDDSKWLFSVRSDEELEQYINLDRVLLILMDYPNFDEDDFKDIRITAFEIYPKDPRCHVFNYLIDNHYNNIYLPKIAEKNKANPMNLHPYSFQFYKCNPTLVFNCIIKDIEGANPTPIITDYVLPNEERKGSLLMPTDLLKDDEWYRINYDKLKAAYPSLPDKYVFMSQTRAKKCKMVPTIDENIREDIPLRPIVSVTQRAVYHR